MNKSVAEILVKYFPEIGSEFPMSGGWGFTQEDACIIECTDQLNSSLYLAWKVINTFIEKRIYMQLIVSKPMEDRYSGITWKIKDRKTIHINGRIYEWELLDVSAFADKDWKSLKDEWEGPHGISSQDFDVDKHIQRRKELLITKESEYWFDVTLCHSCSLFSIELPWVVSGFARGEITDYESQNSGLGYSVEYHGLFLSGALATLYLYTNGLENIPEDLFSDIMIEHFTSSVNDTVFVNEVKFNQECTLVKSGTFASINNLPTYHYAELKLASSSGPQKSFLFFRSHMGYFMKVRITLPVGNDLNDIAFSFAAELLNIIKKETTQHPPSMH